MADIDYPAELPRPLDGNFSEGSLSRWIEDRGEVGAPDRRARFTRTLESFTFRLRVVSAQRATLKQFYDVTLVDGMLPFNWTHPTSGDTFEVQFKSQPRISHVSGRIWDIDVELQEI